MGVQLGSATGKIEIDASGVTAGIEAAKNSLNGMEGSLGSAVKGLDTFSQSATRAGTGLMSLGGLGVGAGAMAVKVAGDFEESMNILQVAVGDAGGSIDDLREIALKAGADVHLVGVGASDAALMMTNLTKAGLSTDQMLGDMQGYLAGTAELGGALRAAIDLAAASELDFDQASKLVITTMSTYGISADQIVQKMGNFVQAADASVASVGDLYASQQNIGPTAASFGFGIEDVNTALAIFSTRGLTGAEAGTNFKSMLNNMLRPTKDVNAALASLNLSFYDSEGAMKPLPVIVKDFDRALGENAKTTLIQGGATKAQADQIEKYQKKISNLTTDIEMYSQGAKGATMTEEARAKKLIDLNAQLAYYRKEHDDLAKTLPDVTQKTVAMTQKQRNQYVTTIAGTYGQKAMNILLAEGSEGWDKMTESIGDAATMQESAAARTKGFNASMEQLRSAVETFLIRVGTPLINDVLTPMVKVLSNIIGKIAELNPAWFKWFVIASGVLVALGGVLVTVGKLAGAVSGITKFIGLMGTLGKAGGLLGPLSTAIAGIGAALGPILLVVAAVAAAVGLLYLAWKNNFLGIRDLLDKIIGPIKSFVDTAVRAFKQFLGGKITLDDFIARLKWAFGNLSAAIAPAWATFKANFLAWWGEIAAALGRVWDAIKEIIIRALAEFLAPIFGSVDEARTAIMSAFENVKTFLGNVWEGIKTAAAAAWEAIKGVIAGVVESIRGYLGVLIALLSGDFAGAWAAIKTTVVRVWEEIKTGILNAVAVIAPQVAAAWESIKTGIVERAEAIRAGVAEKWEAVRASAAEKWESIRSTISTVVGGIKDFVVNTLGEIVSAAAGLFGKIIDAVAGGGGGGGAGAGSGLSLGSLLNVAALRTTVAEAVTVIRELQTKTGAIMALVPPLFATAWVTVQAQTEAIWTAIQSWWTSWHATELSAFATWLATLQAALQAAWTAIQLSLVMIWTAINLWWTMWRAAQLLAFQMWLAAVQMAFTMVMTAIKTFVLMIFEQMRAGVTATMEMMRGQVVAIIQTMASQVMAILSQMVSDAYDSGVAFGENVADGIRASIPAAVAAAKALADAVARVLPNSPDAREGPLSHLTDSGRAIPENVAAGLRANMAAVVGAAEAMAAGVNAALPQGGALDWTAAGRAAAASIPWGGGPGAQRARQASPLQGAGQQTIQVTINNPVGEVAENSIVRQLRNLAYIGVLAPTG